MTRIHVYNGRISCGGQVMEEAILVLEGARIAAIETGSDLGVGPASASHALDLEGGWLLPGFIDTQVNGGGGVLFNTAPTPEGIAAIGAAHATFGTTAFLPTLVSAEPATIARALEAVDIAIARGVPGVVGIHVEGPFINPVRKGIHAEANLRRLEPALLDLLTAPHRGKVLLTLAPELADPADLERLASAGVILSAGHSDASLDEARRGFAHGITGVTHLFNAMAPLHHRAPGLIGAALDDDAIWCGLIADGLHLTPEIVRLAVRVKGPDKIMLVTDAMPPVGNGGHPFVLDGQEIRMVDGRCTDAAGTLAGSGLDMASALRNAVRFTGLDVVRAATMASASPARFLGLADELGRIEVGFKADFVVLDADLALRQTWISGQRAA